MLPHAAGGGEEREGRAAPFRCRVPPDSQSQRPVRLVARGCPAPQDLAGIVGLTVYAVSARYPDEIDEATEAELNEAVALARKAVRWAESTIAAG